MAQTKYQNSLAFDLSSLNPPSDFGPRLGKLSLNRPDAMLEILTPGIITSTSRGVVPHLSRDNTRATDAIRWVHVPFETFLEHSPPVPILQPGPHPLHKFLGFLPRKHIVTMSLRDPFDAREMPSNGNNFVTAYCIRGVRQVGRSDWRKYVLACDPDIVIALPDIPFTPGPHSQKRVMKSIERSTAWLSDLLQPIPLDSDARTDKSESHPAPRLNVFVHMAGGTATTAREAFSQSLVEPLYGNETSSIRPFKTFDEGVAGYTFDLIPLHQSLSTPPPSITPTPAPSRTPTPFIASLSPLPRSKPRIVHSAGSPHEMLVLIRDVGIDLFDAHWAQRAADIGVALDFVFPTASSAEPEPSQKNLGHNLYDTRYAKDFSPFSDVLRTSRDQDSSDVDVLPSCPCIACSPTRPLHPIHHSALDGPTLVTPSSTPPPAPFTRAYVHHLLHTHEMSAHTLLASHNLSMLDIFFGDVRRLLVERPEEFEAEVAKFVKLYDGSLKVFGEAKKCWAEVELARGKGRLAREKQKQDEDTLGTAVEL
ncbi:hypothetical protein HETIRDRAFT_65670 [Heterobasidion irregulare TC 32-1]|uniref:tRNA-guanine(15) transglycosylase-like domain-containing protein n=1 Tax=Heterobasidion irregulare (strain TC 32-1) TaxID=747525 RepID=W4JW83_HETIT|nr:uncharacterized protein HETIRDRAFT_65670 [Heterobasidion irregulare TC 32-1]ETW77151.1 hypothetical protein HETIRDRAFT_65670 [Heterobasidion irregulare TC 32-1]